MGNCKSILIYRYLAINMSNLKLFMIPITTGKVINVYDNHIVIVSFYNGTPYKFFLKLKNTEDKKTIIQKFLFKVVKIQEKEIDSNGLLHGYISIF